MKLALISSLAAFAAATAAYAQSESDQQPVILELFTSQGCSACPKANQMLGELSERADIVGVAFAVDYWDYLGWRDTFARPEFVARQRSYARRLRNRGVYTPQMVVHGRMNVPGLDRSKVETVLAREAGSPAGGPAIAIRVTPIETEVVKIGGGDPTVEVLPRPSGSVRVDIGAGTAPSDGADVWFIAYLPGRRDVSVEEGENNGKTVAHYNMATRLEHAGTWTGEQMTFTTNVSNGESVVILVQEIELGPIISASHGALTGAESIAAPTTFDRPETIPD